MTRFGKAVLFNVIALMLIGGIAWATYFYQVECKYLQTTTIRSNPVHSIPMTLQGSTIKIHGVLQGTTANTDWKWKTVTASTAKCNARCAYSCVFGVSESGGNVTGLADCDTSITGHCLCAGPN
jgi:hypothetical protein